MNEADIARLREQLPALHELLRAAGLECGPDTWLALQDLLLTLARQGKLPSDPAQWSEYIGPIVCGDAEQQRAFPELFATWWTGSPQRPVATLESQGQLAQRSFHQAVAVLDRRWRFYLLAALLALIAAAFGLRYWHPASGTDPLPKAAPALQEPARVSSRTTVPKPEGKIEIDDWAPPNRLPPTWPAIPEAWQPWLQRIERAVPAVPAILIALWLAGRYRRIWALSKGGEADPAGRLGLRLPRRLFGGDGTLGSLQRLRATRSEPTRRLDIAATVDASVRNAGRFAPRYLSRKVEPHYLLLVQSHHVHDQRAALVDAMMQRFAESRLLAECYRFRDDPGVLVPWSKPDQPSRNLGWLSQEWPDAQLIIVSDASILYQPMGLSPAEWFEQLEAWRLQGIWTHRAWLAPAALDARIAQWLWQRAYLVLPLQGSSLGPLSHWLNGWGQPPAQPEMSTPPPLPEALRGDPQRWLAPRAPAGADPQSMLDQLRRHLSPEGWLLLQALAVFPVLRWELTQALDYLLWEDDPPERREQRLAAIGRLPWLQAGHLPDYLRELLLEQLAKPERRRIRDAYARLLALPERAQASADLTLPLAAPKRSGLRRRVLDALHRNRRRPGVYDDSLFLNLLLGDPLSLLDFHLPRALARRLPGAHWRLNPWPALFGVLLAAGLGWGALRAWQAWGEPWLNRQWAAALRSENRLWTVRIADSADTRQLSFALASALQAQGFSTAPLVQPSNARPATHLLRFPPQGLAAAQRVRSHLVHAAFGAPVDMQPDTALAGDQMELQLAATYVPDASFNDKLANAPKAKRPADFSLFRDEFKNPDAQGRARLGPDMVALPGGSFTLGCQPEHQQCRDDELPAHEVRLKPFALGRYEVTFADYDIYVQSLQNKQPQPAPGCEQVEVAQPSDSGWGRGRRPVINMDWEQARCYAAWLAAQTGLPYRLPSEAEFEYALRAGGQTEYPWGDSADGAELWAWYWGNSQRQTHPVGLKRPNPFGLSDLSGNVWEWVADCWHDSYQGAPAEGGAWESGESCGARVVRGGSWFDSLPRVLRSAFRGRSTTVEAFDLQGFRVARDL